MINITLYIKSKKRKKDEDPFENMLIDMIAKIQKNIRQEKKSILFEKRKLSAHIFDCYTPFNKKNRKTKLVEIYHDGDCFYYENYLETESPTICEDIKNITSAIKSRIKNMEIRFASYNILKEKFELLMSNYEMAKKLVTIKVDMDYIQPIYFDVNENLFSQIKASKSRTNKFEELFREVDITELIGNVDSYVVAIKLKTCIENLSVDMNLLKQLKAIKITYGKPPVRCKSDTRTNCIQHNLLWKIVIPLAIAIITEIFTKAITSVIKSFLLSFGLL